MTFAPTATGSASGTLSVASNAPCSPLTVALSGTGTTTSAEGPYGGTPAAVPGTVLAANYDTGGQGVAYNVTSVNGTASSYRTDGVDLEACSDAGCGDDLGWTTAGQWFRYTVNVATAGTYTVSLRLASPSGVTDGLHIASSAGTSLSGNINVPATGGWQAWQTATATVTLPAGQQTLTIDQDNPGWNLCYLAFTSGAGTTNLAQGKAVTASSSTQAYVPANTVDGNTSTLLGSRQRRLASHHHRQPGSRALPQLRHHRPAAIAGLAGQDPDAVRPRLRQRQLLLRHRRTSHLHLEPRHRQHGHHRPPRRDQRPVRAAQLHRQQRPERRPGLRDPDLRNLIPR